MKTNFFKKQKVSNKILEKGPSYEDQLLSLATKTYWIVLNTHFLRFNTNDIKLSDRTNALKHALQTYGPNSKSLPDLRDNKGLAQGKMFHGHVNDSNGTTHVLEWSIIDSKKRVMAITNFAKHENYNYKKDLLTLDEMKRIIEEPNNKLITDRMIKKAEEAAKKVERVEANNCVFRN